MWLRRACNEIATMSSTSRQPDLFGNPQADLFDGLAAPGHTPERMAPIVRPRLAALLAAARAADRMPWDAQSAEVNAIIFHQMANWLPPEERDEVRAAFRTEFDRLRAVR